MGNEVTSATPDSAVLQILATTDLHMQILPYDYLNDRADVSGSLVQLADLIGDLQADPAVLTLLCDNGDFAQGNPLADRIAATHRQGARHPVMAAFAALGYDAIGLGNHDFDYGLPFLRDIVRQAPCPVVCANIDWQDSGVPAVPFALLDRQIRCRQGGTRPIRIGVTGFVPPQITAWGNTRLQGAITACDIVMQAQDIVPRIRAAGADIVIALCHAGIGAPDHLPGMENAALPLAAVPGLDVILTGHTHDMFPDPARPAGAGVDPVAGTLHGKPAAGAGFLGNALGVVRLGLHHDAQGWHIAGHSSKILPVPRGPARSLPGRAIAASVQAAHRATLAAIRQPVARTNVPIHSFFARVRPDLPCHLLGAAMVGHARDTLPGLAWPVVAVVTPLRAGGRAGAAHYVDIAPGPITRRDISAIYPFTDTPVMLQQTGAQLLARLEQAVSGYHRIAPYRDDQPLFHPCFAPYVFDTVYGLTYAVDLSAPARHDATGRIVLPQASRIRDLCYQGRPVQAGDVFVVVASSYRAFGGGGYVSATRAEVVHLSARPLRDILTTSLHRQQVLDNKFRDTWRFAPIAQASAGFASAPGARHDLPEGITHHGQGPADFHCYRLTF